MARRPVSGFGLKWTNEDGFGGDVDGAAEDEDGAIVGETTVGDVAGDFDNDATADGGGAADDGGGEGAMMVCTTAVEGVTEV